MGEEYAFKREKNHRIDSELVWHNEMARLVQKAFQPRSYAAAMESLQVIVSQGTPAASRALSTLVNPIGAGMCRLIPNRQPHSSNLTMRFMIPQAVTQRMVLRLTIIVMATTPPSLLRRTS